MTSGTHCGDLSVSLSSVQCVHMATKGGEEYRVVAQCISDAIMTDRSPQCEQVVIVVVE